MFQRNFRSSGMWDDLLVASVAALAGLCTPGQQAVFAEEAVAAEGRIVNISPDGQPTKIEAPVPTEVVPAKPSEDGGSDQNADAAAPKEDASVYWIGIQGGPLVDPVLRTHLQLADDVGVAVMEVLPGSPADKAGLKKHDVLISVGGEPISDMPALQQVVATSQGKPLELTLMRLAKETTVKITPEVRPADVAAAAGAMENPLGGAFDFNFPMRELSGIDANLNEALKQLHGQFRVIGPGAIIKSQQFNLGALPGGVSVSIARQNDEPATITVKKGDQTWQVKGNDAEAIAKLPEDVRPFVEQMLNQPGPNGITFGVRAQAQAQQAAAFADAAKAQAGEARAQAAAVAAQANENVLHRMQEMEQRLQEMQQRLEKEIPAPPAEAPKPKADPSST